MNHEDLRKFYVGLLGFPGNVFDEADPNYPHNKRSMEKLNELSKEGKI